MTTTLLAAETHGTELISLAWIVLIVWAAPLVSALTRAVVPGVVLLLAGGMLIGPHGLGLAVETGGMAMLSDIGLGLLFLLAGFELEVASLTGRGGRRAAATWTASMLVATAAGWVISGRWETAVAIGLLLTSTAIAPVTTGICSGCTSWAHSTVGISVSSIARRRGILAAHRSAGRATSAGRGRRIFQLIRCSAGARTGPTRPGVLELGVIPDLLIV